MNGMNALWRSGRQPPTQRMLRGRDLWPKQFAGKRFRSYRIKGEIRDRLLGTILKNAKTALVADLAKPVSAWMGGKKILNGSENTIPRTAFLHRIHELRVCSSDLKQRALASRHSLLRIGSAEFRRNGLRLVVQVAAAE